MLCMGRKAGVAFQMLRKFRYTEMKRNEHVEMRSLTSLWFLCPLLPLCSVGQQVAHFPDAASGPINPRPGKSSPLVAESLKEPCKNSVSKIKPVKT